MKSNPPQTSIPNYSRMVIILLVGLLGFLPVDKAYADGARIYVTVSAVGANDGTSWTNAYTSLQLALSTAASGDEIWVAAGTYYPTVGTDKTATFTLKTGVSIYGGFAGTETLVMQRNPKSNLTILSGDIGVPGNSNDNSFHVVIGSGTDSSAVLDGFTITGGNAINADSSPWGGGMLNSEGSPTLVNLVFSGNKAVYGGGMYNFTASPAMTNITFVNNSADRAGGAYNTVNSNPVLTNVTFANNTAHVRGGGMTAASSSSPTLRNVTFSGNTAVYGGGFHAVFGGNPTMENVTFSGNVATQGGAMFNEDSTAIITNSIFYNNTGGEIFNQLSTPVVTYSIVMGGYSGTGNLDVDPVLGPLQENGGFTQTMALSPGSPAIDSGDDTNCPDTDQRGVTRPQGTGCDIGAYEADESFPMVASILRADPNPTMLNSVNLTVTFSETVTGVDITDFALTKAGVNGAGIINVLGTGDSYTVSVNTGSGNGTIRLDVVDDDSIKDTANNPLGEMGLGNGNFNSGEVYSILKGADTVGVFRPSNGVIFLKNSNTSGFADVALNYGIPGDYPVVGDWDGDGDDTIGVYRNGTFYLRNSNTVGFADIEFAFGQAGDQPIAGDWDGDGIDTIGIFRPSTGLFMLRNSNSAGSFDVQFYLGNVGDVGIAGDWNGDGMDTTGVFRPANGIIFLKNTNVSGFADVELNYGIPGDKPVVGDWDNDGDTTIGVDRNGRFYLRNSNTVGFADIEFILGNPGDMPIAGNWDALP